MVNLKIHIKDINDSFTGTMFAMYTQGEWGITVGMKTDPLWYTRMRKQIADWQYNDDCCALCAESRGKVVNACCHAPTTLFQYTVSCDCCPPPTVMNPVDRLCYFPGSGTPFTTIPCPYCPTGYTFNNVTGVCDGPGGLHADPGTIGSHCLGSTGAILGGPVFPCPDLVHNFTISAYAAMIPNLDHCSIYTPLFSGSYNKPCS